MAFGIDDALAAATAGINLTDTVIQVVKRYRKSETDVDIRQLLEEVRSTAIKRIDEADLALAQLERMLVEKNINLGKRLSDVIAEIPFWHPFEQRRLNQIRKRFNELSDSIYSATDDIAALVRCGQRTAEMNEAVAESVTHKHNLHLRVLNAGSIGEAIYLLRDQLKQHKEALGT